MAKSFCRVSLTLFLIILQWSNSYGFIWPFTSLWSKPSSGSSSFSELLFRPYLDTDLTALSSNPDTSSVFGSELNSQQQQNLGFLNVENNNVGSISSSGGIGVQQSDQQVDVQNLSENSDPQSWSLAQQQGQQQQISQPNYFFYNQEDFSDPKRFTHITKFRQGSLSNGQQGSTVQSTSNFASKYTSYPNLDNQYFIIQKPIPPQLQQPERIEMSQQKESNAQHSSNIPGTNQQQAIINQFPSNNWVYLSPVNKLNSPQQPIILEAYIDPNGNNQQQFTIKGVKNKLQTPSLVNGSPQRQVGGTKIPLLSWLPVSASQIHLPFWFKAKQKQSRQPQQENLNQNKQQQFYSSYLPSSSFSPVSNQKPIYIYSPGTSSMNNVGVNSGTGYYIQTPVMSQVTKSLPSQSQTGATGTTTNQILWSSDNSNNAHINRISYGNVQPQSSQLSSLQFWLEPINPQQQPSRIQFPKPQINYQPQQEYQTQVIQTVPSTTVTQIEANQDLGGWDSIPLPDIVKPVGSSSVPTMSIASGNQDNGDLIHDNNVEPLQSSQSILMNETSNSQSISSSLIQQQQASTNFQQSQPSHRLVYQPTSINSNSTNPMVNSIGGNTGRSFYSHQQFTPIYQLIQTSNSGTSGTGTFSPTSSSWTTTHSNFTIQN